MHSSRMPARLLPVSPSMHYSWDGVCLWWGGLPLVWGEGVVCIPACTGANPPTVDRQTGVKT